MHILHVISGLPQAAGTSVFCAELSDHLTLEGVDCSIVVQRRVPDEYLPAQKVPVYEGLSSLRDLPFLPDILHVHALWSPCLHQAVQWARKKKIKIVVSPHGMLTPWALGQKRLKKAVALAAYQYWDLRAAALFHATCESEVRDIRRLGLKQPVVVAPLGVEVPSQPPFLRAHSPRTALFVSRIHPKKGLFNLIAAWARMKESVSSEPLSVNGHAETQPKTADDSRLTVHGVPWQLVIAGPDQAGHKAELVAEAERLGLTVSSEPLTVNRGVTRKDAKAQSSDQVKEPQKLNATDGSPLTAYGSTIPDIIFTGPVYGADKDALYRMADLFVLPTYSENFGVVVIEALAQGCPVITTKGAPWAELMGSPKRVNSKPLIVNSEPCCEGDDNQRITVYGSQRTDFTANGRCGWWIDIGVQPLTEALTEAMCLGDVERDQMGSNGLKLVRERYSWATIAQSLKREYECA